MKKKGIILTTIFALAFGIASASVGSVRADESELSFGGSDTVATAGDAEEVEIATATEAVYDAPAGNIADPYHRVSFEGAFDSGSLSFTEPFTTDSISKNDKGGIFVTASAADLNSGRITFNDKFNFDSNPVGRFCIDALAESGLDGYVDVYIDDSPTPFASIKIRNANSKWNNEGFLTEDVYTERLTGEHMVSVGFSFAEGSAQSDAKVFLRSIEFAENTIPIVYFDIDESDGNPTIDDMNNSANHSVKCTGGVRIQVPDGYTSEYTGKTESDYNNLKLEYVRGRGNSTWFCPKKPYKFKLDKGADLFGMGKNKHWVLLANYYDNSLIRNRMTYWLGAELGMEFTPQCIPVEVVMNDRYYGTYLLAEQIRVDESRVNIDELSDDDTDLPIITGGYLLSMPSYDSENASLFETKAGVSFCNETPDFVESGNDVQKEYIRDYVQKTEDAIMGPDYKDKDGVSYKEYLDFDAAVDYWWIQELSKNGDAYGTDSTYLYKKRNGKLYWGPLWDFDFVAWGDLDYQMDFVEGFNYANTPWFTYLKDNKEFIAAAKNRWPDIDAKLDEMTRQGGLLDRYYEENVISESYNNEVWGRHQTPLETYKDEIEDVRTWITGRRNWINNNLDDLDDLTLHLRLYVGDELFDEKVYLHKRSLDKLPEAPEKKGYVFLGWYTEDGKKLVSYSTELGDEDVDAYARYKKYEDTIKAEKIYLKKYVLILGDDISFDIIEYELFPSDYEYAGIVWESSDESVAIVDQSGEVESVSEGECSITATLTNGEKATVKVKVVPGALDKYKAKSLKYDDLQMYVGDIIQHIPTANPEYSRYDFYYINSEESVASIDEFGIVTALKPGVTEVEAFDSFSQKRVSCKITVSEKRDEPVEAEYVFTKGDKGSWKKGSSDGLVFEAELVGDKAGTFDHYKGAKVDGTLLGRDDCIAENGSIKLTIKPDYLEKLAVGEHTLELIFDDGNVSTTFTILDKDSDKDPDKKDDKPSGNGGSGSGSNNNSSAKGGVSPKTGDATPILLVFIIAISSLVAIYVLLYEK